MLTVYSLALLICIALFRDLAFQLILSSQNEMQRLSLPCLPSSTFIVLSTFLRFHSSFFIFSIRLLLCSCITLLVASLLLYVYCKIYIYIYWNVMFSLWKLTAGI